MKSVKLQLLVTLVAVAVAAGFFIHRGLPPSGQRWWSVLHDTDTDRLLRHLRWGVHVDTLTSGSQTQLHEAARYNYIRAAEVLIDLGASVDARDGSGDTPLHIAASRGNDQVIEMLLDSGADVNSQARVFSPLWRAMKTGKRDTAKLLLRRGAKPDSLVTRLHIAAFLGQLDEAKRLVAAGEIVQGHHRGRLWPLHVVSDAAMARFLIDEGARVDAYDSWGKRPLHFAVLQRNRDLVALLIAEGANVNDRDSNWLTPLHYAVAQNHVEVAELLVAKGADLSAKTARTDTPLQMAVKLGHADMADLLRRHGARE